MFLLGYRPDSNANLDGEHMPEAVYARENEMPSSFTRSMCGVLELVTTEAPVQPDSQVGAISQSPLPGYMSSGCTIKMFGFAVAVFAVVSSLVVVVVVVVAAVVVVDASVAGGSVAHSPPISLSPNNDSTVVKQ